MSADPRLVALRLAGGWARKVELDEISLDNAFDLLVERVNAIVHVLCPTCGMRPCGDAAFCESMRAADQKVAASRKCAQCGAGGDLDPHQWKEKRTIVYLHRGACERFWKSRNR